MPRWKGFYVVHQMYRSLELGVVDAKDESEALAEFAQNIEVIEIVKEEEDACVQCNRNED